ncbi:DegT/DnrJ/EryC1/StrS family aminotransferase [Nanoarchaeota archaeon]
MVKKEQELDYEKASKDKHKAEDIISKYTKHKHVKLVQRGNAAILCALAITKKINPRAFLLIPDQGGWISFKTYPKMFGFDIRTVKTNRGLIDLIDLESKAESGAALLVTSYAGYFADQPMKYISKICRRYNCLLIEDAAGALGHEDLCDGDYSDIIVGSFGRWKPINLEYGGFISCAKKECYEAGREIFSTTNFFPQFDILLEKLKTADKRVKAMTKLAKAVKEDISKRLPHLKILHKDLEGLNVVVRYADKKEKQEVLDYCEVNDYDFVECPAYTRIDEDAISIELKRIDTNGAKKKKA